MKNATRESSRKPPKPAIIHQDAAIVVVEKPAGVWPREGVFDDPGVYELIAPNEAPEDVAFIQITPLEFEMSGAVVYATDAESAATIRRQFESREAGLRYSAVVRGPLLADAGEIAHEQTAATADDEASASMAWRVIDAFVGFALLECTTSSLAEHQLRKHLQHAGMPLAVDDRFGGATHLMLSSFKAGYRKSKRRPERPLIERPSAHLSTISFRHPTDGRELSFDIEPPKDFRALLNQLDRFARVPK